MSALSRYEASVDRAFHRPYVMLERRQAKRRGELVPAPLAIAVSGFPAGRSRGEGAPAHKSEILRTRANFARRISARGCHDSDRKPFEHRLKKRAKEKHDRAQDLRRRPRLVDHPAPVDDGVTRHLLGTRVASVPLPATNGSVVDLASLSGRTIVYAYPRTGQPGTDNPPGWDMIPGARGCTPQSCAFRDHFAELKALGVEHLFGLSTQEPDYQREAAERLHLPFTILSDEHLRLTRAMNLPTFETSGMTLLKRFTLVIDDTIVKHVFYPVFPPDRSASDVIAWLSAAKR